MATGEREREVYREFDTWYMNEVESHFVNEAKVRGIPFDAQTELKEIRDMLQIAWENGVYTERRRWEQKSAPS